MSRPRATVFTALPVLVLLLAACGGSDGDPTPTEPPSTEPPDDDDPPAANVAGTVGPSGGTVSTDDGAVTLSFPEGAVSEDTDITVEELASPPSSPDLLPGSARDFGPDGAQFAEDVEIVWRYDPANLPGGANESSVGIYRAQDGGWVEVEEIWADTVNRTVTAKLVGFSGYALLANRVADVEGLWSVEVQDTETTCPPEESDAFQARIEQDGKTLELSGTDADVAGITLPGELSGNSVHFSGTVTVDGAQETLDIRGWFSADVTKMSGTSDWSVQEEDGSTCSGKAEWSAVRD